MGSQNKYVSASGAFFAGTLGAIFTLSTPAIAEDKPPKCSSNCAAETGDTEAEALEKAEAEMRKYGCKGKGGQKDIEKHVSEAFGGRVRVQLNYKCSGDDPSAFGVRG